MPRPGTPRRVCGSSSDRHPRSGSRGKIVLLCLCACWLASCAGTPPAPERAASPDVAADSRRTASGPGSGSPALELRDPPSGFPDAALDLLTQSSRDSCGICAEQNRRKAFDVLDEFYRPGTVITSTPERRFVRQDGPEPALALSSTDRTGTRLTFRFHTPSENLVGIDPADYSEEEWIEIWEASPSRSVLDGAIRVIGFAYGDGPSYLYFPSENHLQIQCKLLELRPVP